MFQFLTKTKNYTKKKENMEYSQGKKNQKFPTSHSCVEALQPLVPPDVPIFGYKVFKKAIKLKWGHHGGP